MKIILFFQVKENKKVTVMNELNNFASVIMGHYGNTNILLWTSEHPSGLRTSGYFLGSEAKCLDFHNALK